jgi:hypothetical protein
MTRTPSPSRKAAFSGSLISAALGAGVRLFCFGLPSSLVSRWMFAPRMRAG